MVTAFLKNLGEKVLRTQDDNKRSVLHHAVAYGHVALTQLLLAEGAGNFFFLS